MSANKLIIMENVLTTDYCQQHLQSVSYLSDTVHVNLVSSVTKTGHQWLIGKFWCEKMTHLWTKVPRSTTQGLALKVVCCRPFCSALEVPLLVQWSRQWACCWIVTVFIVAAYVLVSF